MRQSERGKPRRRVAPIFVEEALSCGAASGQDMGQILRAAKVAPEHLDHLSSEEFARIWLALAARMEDEFFGLGRRPMPPGSTVLLGHAIQGAKTLEVSLRRSLRFLRVILEEPFGTLSIDGRNCTVTVHDTQAGQGAFKYRAFFLIVHSFNCWAVRERIPIKRVQFPCPEPAKQSDYGDFFGVPVEFDQPVARISFDRKYLTRQAGRSEKELKSFLRALPEAFLRGYREQQGITRRIVDTCLQGAPSDWPGADAIAARLNMSRSTLHRLLAEADQSLTQLKDEQRRNRAVALLSRTDATMSQISEAVGYADEGAFYRAFKRWYQTTPSRFRDATKG